MKCANCGQSARANDHFCDRCGAPLRATAGPAAAMPSTQMPSMAMPASSMFGPSAIPSPAPSPAPMPGMTPLAPVSAQESRLWAVAAHLSTFVGVFGAVIGVIVGPLAIYLIRRDTDLFAAENAREALNFNLSLLVYSLCLLILTFVTLGFGLLIAIPAMIVIGIAWFVLSIIGAIRAWNDGVFRYPFTIRFVK